MCCARTGSVDFSTADMNIDSEDDPIGIVEDIARLVVIAPGHQNTKTLDFSRVFEVWLVRDSNPRRLSQLIYSQFPLAAWVTSHCCF